jgi:hypothetical protein
MRCLPPTRFIVTVTTKAAHVRGFVFPVLNPALVGSWARVLASWRARLGPGPVGDVQDAGDHELMLLDVGGLGRRDLDNSCRREHLNVPPTLLGAKRFAGQGL